MLVMVNVNIKKAIDNIIQFLHQYLLDNVL
jgi:hypothetical protein